MTLEIILVTSAPQFSPPGALQTSVPTQSRGRAVAGRRSGSPEEAQDFPSQGHSHPWQLRKLVQLQSSTACDNRLPNIAAARELETHSCTLNRETKRNPTFSKRSRLNIMKNCMDNNVPEDLTATVLHKIMTFEYP